MGAVSPGAVRVHLAMAAIPSIARIGQEAGEWQLQGVERFVSLEDVEWANHAAERPLILANRVRLHEAMSALSVAGFAHEGALAFGVEPGGQMSLVSLEACRRDPANAWQVNLLELSDFYRGFGLSEMADLVAEAAEVFLTQRQDVRHLPSDEQMQYLGLDSILGERPALCAYLCPASPRLDGQATRRVGAGDMVVMLTTEPITEGLIKVLDALPLAHLPPGLEQTLTRPKGRDSAADTPCL